MCYKCSVCEKVVPPRESLKRFAFYRNRIFNKVVGGETVNTIRREIEREIPVCGDCYFGLEAGIDINRLRAQRQVRKVAGFVVAPPPVVSNVLVNNGNTKPRQEVKPTSKPASRESFEDRSARIRAAAANEDGVTY